MTTRHAIALRKQPAVLKALAVLEDLATTAVKLVIFHASAQNHQRLNHATTAAKKVTSLAIALSQASLVLKAADKVVGVNLATAMVTPRNATHAAVLVTWPGEGPHSRRPYVSNSSSEIAPRVATRVAVSVVVAMEAADLSELLDNATTVEDLVTWPGTATRAEA